MNYRGVTADPKAAAETLAARCEAEPGLVLTEIMGRLRARAEDVVCVLGGQSVRFELLLTGWTVHEAWLVISSMGNVAVVTDRAMLGSDQRPHAVFRGEPVEVLRVVLGVTPLEDAVAAGVFIPFVPVARFSRLLRLVSQDLLVLAGA